MPKVVVTQVLSEADQKIKGHTNSCEVIKTRGAINAFRVYNSKCIRWSVRYSVMIGYNHIYSKMLCSFHSSIITGPAVHSYYKVYSLWQRIICNMVFFQTVSFFYPVRDIVIYICSYVIEKF